MASAKPMFKIVVVGEPKLTIVEDAMEVFKREAKGAVREASEELLRAVKAQLRKHKYPPAAAPGAPPAMRFEEPPYLMASFKTLRIRVTKYAVFGGVYSNHEGAARLEYGATDIRGIKTYPHPYLAPALADAEPSVTNILGRVLDERD